MTFEEASILLSTCRQHMYPHRFGDADFHWTKDVDGEIKIIASGYKNAPGDEPFHVTDTGIVMKGMKVCQYEVTIGETRFEHHQALVLLLECGQKVRPGEETADEREALLEPVRSSVAGLPSLASLLTL